MSSHVKRLTLAPWGWDLFYLVFLIWLNSPGGFLLRFYIKLLKTDLNLVLLWEQSLKWHHKRFCSTYLVHFTWCPTLVEKHAWLTSFLWGIYSLTSVKSLRPQGDHIFSAESVSNGVFYWVQSIFYLVKTPPWSV